MTERILTLSEAADRLGWSRRSLRRALDAASIAPIGRGRLARITEADYAQLVEELRCANRTASLRQESGAAIGTGSSAVGGRMGASLSSARTLQTRRLLEGLRPSVTRGSRPKILQLIGK